jgi:3-deoxy-7-phosphoheptulonate synthase/chorismate mutase
MKEKKMKLEDWRNEIDLIDSEIIKLINQRARIVQKIGALKTQASMPIIDHNREEIVLRKVCNKNQGILKEQAICRIYKSILAESRKIQLDLHNKTLEKGVRIY